MRYILLLLFPILSFAQTPSSVVYVGGLVVDIPPDNWQCDYHPTYCKRGFYIEDSVAIFPWEAERKAADEALERQAQILAAQMCGMPEPDLPFCGELGISPQKCQTRCPNGELVVSPSICTE